MVLITDYSTVTSAWFRHVWAVLRNWIKSLHKCKGDLDPHAWTSYLLLERNVLKSSNVLQTYRNFYTPKTNLFCVARISVVVYCLHNRQEMINQQHWLIAVYYNFLSAVSTSGKFHRKHYVFVVRYSCTVSWVWLACDSSIENRVTVMLDHVYWQYELDINLLFQGFFLTLE